MKIIVAAAKIVRRFANIKWVNVHIFNNTIGNHIKLRGLCKITDSSIGDYTYFGGNCTVKNTTIGKFCSFGPGLICGWGIHPTNGVSTAPMFYSTARQNGVTLCHENKIDESLPIHIGNDVFVGANVVILDGVSIGNGAVVGAGAVVTRDVPPYSIVAGVPAKVVRYRFDETTIEALQRTQWWNFPPDKLKLVERYFFNVAVFLEKLSEK